jgi:glutamine synthetase
VEEAFTGKTLIKGEGDGSSFPSGGLRSTHIARGYTIWDPLSQLYIRRNKGVLYIPALLVSHHGHALDDKTLFRQSEQILKKRAVQLLSKLGVNTKEAVILLGLEQEFFAISKEAFQKRDDLRMLGRALTGNIPPRNQQLGEHYYATIP